jgi:hypothetical protein
MGVGRGDRMLWRVVENRIGRSPRCPTSRGAAKIGYRTVDVFAVKSSCNLVKKTYIIVALLVAKSLISNFRCTTRARPCWLLEVY